MPAMMALARVSIGLAAAASLLLWLAGTTHVLDLRAEPWSDRTWFFNPFAWQIVFFTGFAFVRGWLPAPPRHRGSLRRALSFLSRARRCPVTTVSAVMPDSGRFRFLARSTNGSAPVIDKPHFGIMRYVHFLALAYVAFILAGERGSALRGPGWERVAMVGRQTLAVFLSGLVVAQLLGVVLDLVRFPGVEIVVNVAGCAILYAIARFMTFWKASPPGGSLPRRGRAALGAGALVASLAAATSAQSGELRKLMIPSASLGRELATTIYVPDAPGPLPALYLLHGTNGNETDWPVMGHIGETMDRAIAQGVLPPTLVVMPDGGNSWYVDNPDPGSSGLMARTLAQDIPQAIDHLFSTRACAIGAPSAESPWAGMAHCFRRSIIQISMRTLSA